MILNSNIEQFLLRTSSTSQIDVSIMYEQNSGPVTNSSNQVISGIQDTVVLFTAGNIYTKILTMVITNNGLANNDVQFIKRKSATVFNESSSVTLAPGDTLQFTIEDGWKHFGANLSTVATITWGSITGTMSNQTDLQTALDTKITYAEALALAIIF